MKTITISKPICFDITQTLMCGQCFRFEKTDDHTFCGVALDRYIRVRQTEDSLILTTEEDTDDSVWLEYFDLEADYSALASAFSTDSVLQEASAYANGIRLLRQDRWETLVSFIISQNNNIPRIKGIIKNLSAAFGNTIGNAVDGSPVYSFPTADALYAAGVDALYELKTGFRAKYIYDAARTVIENPGFLDEVASLPTKEAAEMLKTIRGVGDKVAACVLLFGFHRLDAFPIDVWVKRILKTYYPDGLTPPLSGEYAGLAQQYLFYYERCKNGVNI